MTSDESMPSPGDADVLVDARGLRCPVPVIRLARAVRDAGPGALVRLRADDPAARHDVPAWCRMTGHELVSLGGESPESDALVRVIAT